VNHFPFYVKPLLPIENEELKIGDSHKIKFEVQSIDENNLHLTLKYFRIGNSQNKKIIFEDLNLMDMALNPTADFNCENTNGIAMDENFFRISPKNCYVTWVPDSNPLRNGYYKFDFNVWYDDKSYDAHNTSDQFLLRKWCQKAETYNMEFQERQRLKLTYPPPGWVENFKCSVKFYYCGFNYIPGVPNRSDQWRSIGVWESFDFEDDYEVDKIEFRGKVLSRNLHASQDVSFCSSNKTGTGTCHTRYDSVCDNYTYIHKNGSFFTAGQWTNWVDLGEDAITEFEDHSDWFSVGLKVRYTPEDETMDGTMEFYGTGSDQPQLRVTYSYPCQDFPQSFFLSGLKNHKDLNPKAFFITSPHNYYRVAG
jgi:hypothetical protein